MPAGRSMATTKGASAMLRPRRNWTRGVAAQHASLSRWRSPVRIRSGPPSLAFPYAPSARPDGAFLCPGCWIGAPPRYLCHTPPGETEPGPGRDRPRPRCARGRARLRPARVARCIADRQRGPIVSCRDGDTRPDRDRNRRPERRRKPRADRGPTDACRAGRDRRRRDRPGHELPRRPDLDRLEGTQGRPGRHEHPLHGAGTGRE